MKTLQSNKHFWTSIIKHRSIRDHFAFISDHVCVFFARGTLSEHFGKLGDFLANDFDYKTFPTAKSRPWKLYAKNHTKISFCP